MSSIASRPPHGGTGRCEGGGCERVGRGVIIELRAYPQLPLSANLLLSLTMKSMLLQAVRHQCRSGGLSTLLPAFHWIFAILEPSGKGLPLPGTPAW